MGLNREQSRRLAEIERSGTYRDGDQALLQGLHFCPDWDGMAVCDASPEKDCCTCDWHPADRV